MWSERQNSMRGGLVQDTQRNSEEGKLSFYDPNKNVAMIMGQIDESSEGHIPPLTTS